MRNFVLLVIGLIFSTVIVGCGGGSATSATTLPANGSVGLSPSEIKNKTLSLTDEFGNTNNFTFDNISGVNVVKAGVTSTGKYKIQEVNKLIITDTSSTPTVLQTFTIIQKEETVPASAYWLVYDPASDKNSRLYVGVPPDPNYLANRQFVGGAKQTGTGLVTPFQVTTFAGILPGAPGFVNTSTARTALFNQPLDITYDGTRYYAIDLLNNAIRVIDAVGKVTTLMDSVTKTPILFNAPQGLTVTTNGTTSILYVADTSNHVIQKVELDATGQFGTSTLFAGTLAVAGAIDTNNPVPTPAKFNSPSGITTDGTNLYVADSGNHTIRKIQISNQFVSTLAGAAATLGSADGIYTAARFNYPIRLTTDGTRLYVTDFNNRTIRSVQIATGAVVTLAGNAAAQAAQSDGVGPAALFYHPTGITTDGTNLYVTDYTNIFLNPITNFSNKILKLTKTTSASYNVQTIAGAPNYPDIAREGNNTTALFARSRGIVWDGTGLLVTNGTYSFTTDGVSIYNQTSAFNVILRMAP